jgi:hypothetical protein
MISKNRIYLPNVVDGIDLFNNDTLFRINVRLELSKQLLRDRHTNHRMNIF